MRRVTLSFILILLMATISAVGQTTFTVIPPKGAEAGRNFKVTFRVENGDANEPRIGDIAGCRLIFGPSRSTSHSYVITNGRQTSSTTIDFSYTYSTDSAGTYTIPAATISVDGKLLKTEPVKFQVYPSNTTNNSSSGSSNRSAQSNGNFSPLSTGNNLSKEDVFIRMIPTRTTVYEQEPIECTIKLYTKYRQIQNFKAVSQPNFDGCLIEEIPVQPALDEVEEYRGQTYSTAVLKRVIIFPQKSGRLTLNSGKYDITVMQYERINSFFGPQLYPVGEEEIHVNPGDLTIDVKPLPNPHPTEFSGAVGKFNFDSKISNDKLRTNEAATLIYTITGTGNIRYLKEPEVDFPAEFEQYTPKADVQANITGSNVSGTMTVEYTFVPQAPGEYTIPGSEFSYFNPTDGKYVTVPIPSYKVNVARGAGVSVATTTDQMQIKGQMTDILHIKTGANSLSKDHYLLVYSGLYWTIIGILLLLFILGVSYKLKSERRESDIIGMKKARAGKVAKRRLKTAHIALSGNDVQSFYQEILKALWGYLSDKLAMPASQLTRDNISLQLAGHNIPQDTIDKVIDILNQCEMARYTPNAGTLENKQSVLEETEEVMNAIEKIK